MRSSIVRHARALITVILVIAALTATAILTRTSTVRAQQPSGNPAEQVRQMQAMMRANIEAVMEGTLAVMSRKETAGQMATFSKNYLDALVAKGFTRQEALALVAAHSPTVIPGAR
ncbi:MAG TPA: hypothetical protein VGH98_19920 [Gemmatimonadaceae bacterium]|jgi:hypothetical protein